MSTALGDNHGSGDAGGQQILDCLFAIFPAAERAFILLREAESDTLVPVVARGQQRTAEQPDAVAISRTIVQEVMQHKRAILLC